MKKMGNGSKPGMAVPTKRPVPVVDAKRPMAPSPTKRPVPVVDAKRPRPMR